MPKDHFGGILVGMYSVAVTGSEGKVGQALITNLSLHTFEITPLDLPKDDVSDLKHLVEATQNHHVLVHLAWKDLGVNNVDPLNGVMYENAYKAAVENDIGLVIMGSSNHARSHTQREPDGRIRYTGKAEVANNIYGVEKQKMEAMGRYFAKIFGLAVVCVRIGNVNQEDRPRPDVPTRWLSHRDLVRLVELAVQAKLPPGHFEIMYGVSRQPTFDWINSFSYEPLDSAEVS